MKYAAYEQYKPSRIEWLGDVPWHWKIARSDGIISSERRQVQPETFLAEEVFHYSIPVVQEHGTGAVEDGESIKSAKQPVLRKSLLVSKLNPRKATITVAEPQPNLRTLCSTEFVTLFADRCDLRFLTYLTLSEAFRQRLDAAVQSVTRSHQRANPRDIHSFWNAWPSSDEQQTIARFLDAKTSQIDALVAQKRQLIDKLKEKRGALIARTVTRGLPPEAAKAAGLEPNPEMRSADVEWLDEYPCAWSLIPLKHLAAIRYGIGEPPEYVDDGVPLIRATNVDAGIIRERGLVRVNPLDIPAKRIVWLCEGDIIVVRSGAYTADSARIPVEYAGSIAGFDMVVSPRKIESRFLAYVILSLYFKEGQLDIQKMRAAQPHLNAEELGGSVVCVPSKLEQSQIADFLDRETAQTDQLIELAEGVIRSTTEYRQALITSAVTGKIDVRGFAHLEAEAT